MGNHIDHGIDLAGGARRVGVGLLVMGLLVAGVGVTAAHGGDAVYQDEAHLFWQPRNEATDITFDYDLSAPRGKGAAVITARGIGVHGTSLHQGVTLAGLRALKYSTWFADDPAPGVVGEAPRLHLTIDRDSTTPLVGDGEYDNVAFDPSAQDCAAADGLAAPDVWQSWNVLDGCLQSTEGFGSVAAFERFDWATYLAAHPDAALTNWGEDGAVNISLGSSGDTVVRTGRFDQIVVNQTDGIDGSKRTIWDFDPPEGPMSGTRDSGIGSQGSDFWESAKGPMTTHDGFVRLAGTGVTTYGTSFHSGAALTDIMALDYSTRAPLVGPGQRSEAPRLRLVLDRDGTTPTIEHDVLTFAPADQDCDAPAQPAQVPAQLQRWDVKNGCLSSIHGWVDPHTLQPADVQFTLAEYLLVYPDARLVDYLDFSLQLAVGHEHLTYTESIGEAIAVLVTLHTDMGFNVRTKWRFY